MEHGARLSTSRVMAIAFIFMSVLIVLSLSVNVIQGVNNYRLQNEQRTAVTPMAFNRIQRKVFTWGDLWPVKEPDMLTVIMQRLTALELSGEMGRKMDAFKERVIRNSLRPPAVPGIGRTEKYGSRLFDPSVRLAADKVPDTANPSMPIQICPAPPPLFRRIGLAIGYWEPMALTDVTRSPGCMVNLGFSLPAFGKTAQGTAKKDEKQVNGAFYHVHWYK